MLLPLLFLSFISVEALLPSTYYLKGHNFAYVERIIAPLEGITHSASSASSPVTTCIEDYTRIISVDRHLAVAFIDYLFPMVGLVGTDHQHSGNAIIEMHVDGRRVAQSVVGTNRHSQLDLSAVINDIPPGPLTLKICAQTIPAQHHLVIPAPIMGSPTAEEQPLFSSLSIVGLPLFVGGGGVSHTSDDCPCDN